MGRGRVTIVGIETQQELPFLLLTYTYIYIYIYIYIYSMYICRSGSSVGIVTDYGLDGPGSNPGGSEIFRPSRPALGPTQPPVQWVLGLSRG